MTLKLNIYTDETLTHIARVAEADELKIPYRAAMQIIQSLDGLNIDNSEKIIQILTKNITQEDKIIKATFKISDSELDLINSSELIGVCKQLYSWAIGKVNNLKGENNPKNYPTPAKI